MKFLVCFLQEIVKGILPISYEDEIVQRRTQILRDPLQSLLLFPADDVAVSDFSAARVVQILSQFRVQPQIIYEKQLWEWNNSNQPSQGISLFWKACYMIAVKTKRSWISRAAEFCQKPTSLKISINETWLAST